MKQLFQRNPGFNAARQLAGKLADAGFRGVLVGGAVRDTMLGRTPHDFDLVTTAPPEKLLKIFPGAKLVGASFGVVLVKINDVEMEVASARSERFYLDGRHPEQIQYTEDLSLDARRRDFTVNALMYDPVTDELLDFVGGVADLRKGILRAVGNAAERFNEDYLRMLRAVRFAAKLNFRFDNELSDAIADNAHLCAKLTGERIRSELDSILTGKNPRYAFELLESTGLLRVILPEVATLRHVAQPPQFHPEGDVLQHTFLMLEHMVYPENRLAWSVLLHDVGKAVTASTDPDGRIRFFDHESAGAAIAKKIFSRLRFPTADSECCCTAITNHMRFAQVTAMKRSTLRRLTGSPDFALELELHRLDCISCHGKMEGFNFLLETIAADEKITSMPEPLLHGRDLVKAGLKPQPKFKKVLDMIYEMQLSGEITSAETALQAALKMF